MPAGASALAVGPDRDDPLPEVGSDSEVRGVLLEIRDHLLARRIARDIAGEAQVGQAREALAGVQMQGSY